MYMARRKSTVHNLYEEVEVAVLATVAEVASLDFLEKSIQKETFSGVE